MLVVTLDGSGNYTTIADALKDGPCHNTNRHTVYVKSRVYKVAEPIIVAEDIWNKMLAGNDISTKAM